MLREPEKTPCAIATEMPSTRPRHSCRIAPAPPYPAVAELGTRGRAAERRGARAAGARAARRDEAKEGQGVRAGLRRAAPAGRPPRSAAPRATAPQLPGGGGGGLRKVARVGDGSERSGGNPSDRDLEVGEDHRGAVSRAVPGSEGRSAECGLAAAAGRDGRSLRPSGIPRPPGSALGALYLLPSHSGRAVGCVLGDPLHS